MAARKGGHLFFWLIFLIPFAARYCDIASLTPQADIARSTPKSSMAAKFIFSRSSAGNIDQTVLAVATAT